MATKKEQTIPHDILKSVKTLANYVEDDQAEQSSYEEFKTEYPNLSPNKHIMFHANKVTAWLNSKTK